MNVFIQEHLINGKVGFLDAIKLDLQTGIKFEKSQKIKLLQLFKSIAKHLDLSFTYP